LRARGRRTPGAARGAQPLPRLRQPVPHAAAPLRSPALALQAEPQPQAQPRWDRGAFFDVDGTLVSTNVAHAYAYYVFNRGTLLGALGRIVKGLALAPLYKA